MITIRTFAAGQSLTNNRKVENSITGNIVGAVGTFKTNPELSRISICAGTSVAVVITDATGTPTVTEGTDNIVCFPFGPDVGCDVASLTLLAKYTAVSADGKDTDRVTLVPVVLSD